MSTFRRWRMVAAVTASGAPYRYLERVLPRIPDVLQQSIVYLYPSEDDAAKHKPGGSGFIVSERSEVTGLVSRYVVTNVHVAMPCRVLRLNTGLGTTELLSLPQSAWVQHPDGDDVAATLLDIPDAWKVSALPWEDFGPTAARMDELNVGVGDEVFMLGRFIGAGGQVRNEPMARFGNIAMMPGEPVLDGRQVAVEAFLVEMRSLSGFSGSPVFVYIGPATYRGNGSMMPFYAETIGLLGIDTGHKAASTPVLDRTTGRSVDPDWHVAQNTGVAIVTPYWKIRELLDQEEFVERRDVSDAEWHDQQGDEMSVADFQPEVEPETPTGCAQEMCENWSGDGRVCPCVLLGLEADERPIVREDDDL